MKSIKPQGVWLNRTLKDSLVDWGLADVLLPTGPLDGILRDGIRQLMAKSAAFDPNQAAASPNAGAANEHYNWKAQLDSGKTIDQEFVGVTHSLGAYLFFNALNPDASAASAPEPSQEQADDGGRQRCRIAVHLRANLAGLFLRQPDSNARDHES